MDGLRLQEDGSIVAYGHTAEDLAAPKTGHSDPFVSRLDRDGRVLSVRQFGTAMESVEALGMDPDGNTYVAISNTSSIQAHWVRKLDASGDLAWEHQLVSMLPRQILVAPDGSVFVAGSTENAFDDPNGLYDAAVTKLTPAGSNVWTSHLATQLDDSPRALAADGAGGVYLANCGLTSHAGYPACNLVRYGAQGEVEWQYDFGSLEFVMGLRLQADFSGRVTAVGQSLEVRDGHSGFDAFLARFDASGQVSGPSQFGGPASDHVLALALGPGGAVVVTGYVSPVKPGSVPDVGFIARLH